MNMSDDIAGAVMQFSAKSVEEAAAVTKSVLETIYKLLHFIAERDREKRRYAADVKNKEITNIKDGKISIKDLSSHCRNTGEQLVMSDVPMTKEDMHYIATRAKKYSIPIAFRNEKGKDNIYALVRKSDISLFKQIITDNMKEKVKTRPQELANFKCNEWEIPFINAELTRLDLSAQFAKTKNGEYFALYEAKDAKAIEIARSEFVRKAHEIENSIEFSKDKDGFYIIKDKITGKVCSFDDTPNKSFISRELQSNFGYDKNKADIAAQKFGKEMLAGDVKTQYFSDNPINEFSYVSTVSWDKENVLAKAYECYYVTPKEDGISRIVYQKDNGSFAILNPRHQTTAKMRTVLETELGITDIKEQDALIEKAEHVYSVNAKYRKVFGNTEDIHIHNVTFTKNAFDMANVETVTGMLRKDKNGNTYAKTQPIDSVSTEITRKNASSFEVNCTAIATEIDQNGQEYTVPQTQQLILSFSNKKTALEELKEMYKSLGVPETAAKDMAKSVYCKAELQNVAPVIALEKAEITNEHSKVVDVVQPEKVVVTSNNHETIKKMSKDEFIASGLIDNNVDLYHGANEQFLISKASKGIDYGDQYWTDDDYLLSKDEHFYLYHVNGYDNANNTYSEVSKDTADDFIKEHGKLEGYTENRENNIFINDRSIQNGHELHPEGNILLDKSSDAANKTADKLNDITEKIEDVSSRGGR